MRRILVPVLAAVILLGAAAPAAPPDYPVNYIKVEELKAMLDRGVKPDIIDVRNWDAYVEMHIHGARSMPLRAVERRSGEISKTAPVVFY
jgi:rhodanese-related sulfurtransferase